MVQFLDDYYICDDMTIRRAQILEVVVSHCAQVIWSKKPEKLQMAATWAKKLKNAIRKRKDAMKSVSQTPNNSVTSRQSEAVMTGVSGFDGEIGGATPPAKKGANGLTVASVDVILCKEPPRHRSERGHTRDRSTDVDADSVGTSASNSHTKHNRSPGVKSAVPANGLTTSMSSSTTPTLLPVAEIDPTAPGSSDSHTSQPRQAKKTLQDSPALTAKTTVPASDGEGGGGFSNDMGPLTSSSPPLNGLPPGGPSQTEGSSTPPLDSALYTHRDGVAATMPDGDVVVVASTGSPLLDLKHQLPDLPTIPLEVKRLSGGITNELFHVYDEEDPANSVVVRVYGKETERVISRESELFYQSLFLDTYVHGQNFLIYQFLDQHETLPYTEMAKEAKPIARAVANFQVRATLASRHDRDPPLIVEDTPASTPAPQQHHHHHHVQANGMRTTRFERESNYTVHSLTTWVDQITSEEILGKVLPEKRDDFTHVAEQLRAESQIMLAILEKHKESLGESVCHNDLLSANFMRHEKTGALKIIDFDYTKRDYFLFDAANHFNEYTGLECDYEQYFPSDEHMTKFVADYRQSMREELAAAHGVHGAGSAWPEEEILPNEWELFWGEGVATSPRGVYSTEIDAEKEALVVARWTDLVKFLTLCSHLSWSIWSLVQEAVSQLDVDFLEYAKLRFNRYLETKEAYTTGLGFTHE